MSEVEQKQAFEHDCMVYFKLSVKKLKQTEKTLEEINKEKEAIKKANEDLIKSKEDLEKIVNKTIEELS